jgi:L-asparaginase
MDALPTAGYAGVVFEGLGGGHLTREIAEPGRLEALISAMPVVLVSRAGNGEVLRDTYGGFAGSETDLIERGVIFGGALDGPKSRVLLTLLLMRGASRTEIQDIFNTIGPRCGPPASD